MQVEIRGASPMEVQTPHAIDGLRVGYRGQVAARTNNAGQGEDYQENPASVSLEAMAKAHVQRDE